MEENEEPAVSEGVMQTPEQARARRPYCISSVYHIIDFELCETCDELRRVLDSINRNRYQVISITQDGSGTYTVFFRRCVLG